MIIVLLVGVSWMCVQVSFVCQHTRVLVLLQLGQLRLANVHHDCCGVLTVLLLDACKVESLVYLSQRRVACFVLHPVLGGFLLSFTPLQSDSTKFDSNKRGDVSNNGLN
jgi:hypothetical protein